MIETAVAFKGPGARFDSEAIVAEVRREGFAAVSGVFSVEQCRDYCEILEKAVSKQMASGGYFGSRTTQVLYNYFLHDEKLFDLFAHPLMDEVMAALIDKDYVLVSPSARNPHIRSDLPEGKKTSGEGWHVDSRVANVATGTLYQPSMSFYSVVALEPFRAGNSATRYVPKSHLRYQRPPSRDAEMDHLIWEADAGTVIFFDSALWHRAGAATNDSRWSVFNMYGPWFMKPYFRFAENMTREQLTALPPKVQKLLHLNSTPPANEGKRTGTLTTEPVFD
ncbi:hypothetical protein GCM10007276_17060 [Agaricicola taiwanensis]|uniref:Phytanoyl-CoA dioxygenase n=1 Tax=Agaricicola taiwanensis TaxID=591372 RepID=A0A8J2VUI2_9RHOB|nr:phytanoyl-CoA dioxygenase family protein [Agaricicola taiwanensis]GGE40324.1 hypothetical protein GCM10007276_17060 [Agaricicola taiwanensis]